MPILKKYTIIFLVLLFFIQCSNENQYLVEKGKVGYLDRETSIQELTSIFAKDSLVTSLSSENNENILFSVNNDEYIVYSKEGKKLLEIVPANLNDSLSKIKSIPLNLNKFITHLKTLTIITYKNQKFDISLQFIMILNN